MNRFKQRAGQSLQAWEKAGWIWGVDPRGWAQWYMRFWAGRRGVDDERQIRRCELLVWCDFVRERGVRGVRDAREGRRRGRMVGSGSEPWWRSWAVQRGIKGDKTPITGLSRAKEPCTCPGSVRARRASNPRSRQGYQIGRRRSPPAQHGPTILVALLSAMLPPIHTAGNPSYTPIRMTDNDSRIQD